MPTQTDTPVSTGSRQDWYQYPYSVPSKVEAVRTNNGDSSVVFAVSNAAWKWQTFNFSPLEGIVDPVNDASLTAVARAYSDGTGAQTFKLVWGYSAPSGGAISAPDVQYGFGRILKRTSYTTCTVTDGDSGFSLSEARTNGQHGFWMRGTGAYEIFVTYLARYVDYDFVGANFAGPFAHNIASLGGAVIGAGLLLRDMPGLAKYMSRWVGNRSWRLRPDEYEKAWRVWDECRHPRFVFLGG